jgi:hypothetical protein
VYRARDPGGPVLLQREQHQDERHHLLRDPRQHHARDEA